MKLVVADSGPLIGLACTNHIDVLLAIVNEVVIPETVFKECTSSLGIPGSAVIADYVATGRIRTAMDQEGSDFDIEGLDHGEALAISLAVSMQVPILVDDAIGRQVARAKGLNVIGACGILLAAKQRGLITDVGTVMDAWKRTIGYFISDSLQAEVLRRAGEPQRLVEKQDES